MRDIGVALPWWIALPVLVGVVVAAWILLVSLGNALLIVAEAARQQMRVLIGVLTVMFADAILGAGRIAGKLTFGLVLAALSPLERLWRRTGGPVLDEIDARIEGHGEERELRRLWHEEFRDEYPSFDAFLAAFHGGTAPSDDSSSAWDEPETAPPRPPDPFAEACALFGLSPDGGFTEGELTARYRRLMQKAHPEHGGSHESAAQLNTARDFIKRRRGWK